MADQEIVIEYHYMDVKGFRNEVFIVAKLKRISSSPVMLGTVRYAKTSVLERLADIFRCGTDSRNYVDFKEVKKNTNVFGPMDAETEWAAYNEELCKTKGIERLDPFQLRTPTLREDLSASRSKVKYRMGIMNDRPYMVAFVGGIMASPAPIWLTDPYVRESALARLYDVFRVGKQGQVFKDLLECGLKARRTPEKIHTEWDACERSVLREIEYGKTPWLAPEAVLAEWSICEKAVMRATKMALAL